MEIKEKLELDLLLTRKRVDLAITTQTYANFKKPDTLDRRMDALARMLACKSASIAVCIIRGKLYVAAYELYQGIKKDNDIRASINEILSYFSKLVNREERSDQERESVFVKISSSYRFESTSERQEETQSISIPKEFYEKIAKEIVNDNIPKMSHAKKIYGRHADAAVFLHEKLENIYRDFRKLEAFFENRKNADTLLYRALVKGEFEILQREKKAGVHPEMQILSIIVSLINEKKLENNQNNSIYIGVGMLCCFDCRFMIAAANKVLLGQNVGLSVYNRGHHDLRFEEWMFPDGFSNTCDSGSDKGVSLAILISGQAKTYIDALLKAEDQAGANKSYGCQKPFFLSLPKEDSDSDTEEAPAPTFASADRFHDRLLSVESSLSPAPAEPMDICGSSGRGSLSFSTGDQPKKDQGQEQKADSEKLSKP